MIRIIFLFQCVVLPFLIDAQGIKFYEGSFGDVKAEAKKQNKIIFIDCYTSWCGPCKWMAKNVFTDNSVGEFYNTNFICYKIDMEKGEGKEIRKKYNVNAFPTLLFINGDGETENRSLGACDTAEFKKIGLKTLDRENNFGSLLRKYNAGDRTPDLLAKYAMACLNVGVNYDIREYFKTQHDTDLIKEVNLKIMEWYLTDIKSREFMYLAGNRDKFCLLYGKDRIDGKIIEIFRKNLLLLPVEKSPVPIPEAAAKMIQPYHYSDSAAFTLKLLMQYYANGKMRDWIEYGKYCEKYLALVSVENVNPVDLLQIVQNIAKYSDDAALIKKGLLWSETLVENEFRLSSTYLAVARLYKKSGNISFAKEFADKALRDEQSKEAPQLNEINKFINELNQDVKKE